MKRTLGFALFFCLVGSQAWGLCNVPHPRLVCAEYSQTDSTAVAKLTHITSVPPEAPDYFIYSFTLVRLLRGHVSRSFDIYQGNDSGRSTFDWKLDSNYLLFLQRGNSTTHNDWFIDGCGNSGPMTNAGSALGEIQHIPNLKGYGIIAGTVKNSTETIGLPGINVKILGSRYSSKLKTDSEGDFRLKVPAGIYKVTAIHNGISIPGDLFSYEDPSKVVIRPDGCAQVQFTEPQK